MYGRCAHKPPLPTRAAHDVITYQDQLRAKLAQLYDFVELSNVKASGQQKHHFDHVTQSRTFIVGDLVWLSIPTAGKLDPKWEGGWVIQSAQSPITYTISDGRRTKTVHINRLRPRVQPINDNSATDSSRHEQPLQQTWEPPAVEHIIVQDSYQPRYPSRVRQPPEFYRP